jgi:colanic acid/amylovoran biosynthesis glycosyltransferase
MPNVLIFKETLLPPSETFILAQMGALRRFCPHLVGLEPMSGGLPFDQQPLLLSCRASRAADFRAKLYRRTAFAPFFHQRVRELKPDLIHAHFASGGKTLLPLHKLLQLRLVVTLHGGSDVPIQKPRMGIYRELAERADLFLCVSEFIRKQAIDAGYPPEKLLVHYIGIDRSVFYLQPDAISADSVLFVGRLVEMKGCEYLLRAMQTVQARRPSTELTVVGDGPLRPQLERLAMELRVRCKFLGVQSTTTIRELLQKSRLLSLPSVTTSDGHVEGLGIVLVEAQAMGVPVVSTLHAGIPEAVADGVTGTLVPERDSERLSFAILRLLEDRDLWQRYHVATQAHIDRNFDLGKQTALLEDIYAEQIC